MYFLWVFLPKKEPCDTPIQYRLGSFDSRFNINKEDFLKDINTSTTIWGEAINKNLFEYNPKGKLVINLIYDVRQKTTQENEILKTDITKINNLAKTAKEQYLTLQNNSNALEEEYQKQLALFEQHRNDYTSQVEYWNKQGGAPETEYNALVKYRETLSYEQSLLENKRLEVNAMIAKTNDFINKYNLLVNTANVNVDTINKTAGREFEEGVYDPNTNEINIYEFSNKQKLIRVLIHELGHSLGLPHNNNPEAIMYTLNNGSTTELSKEDLQSLKLRCNIKD